MNGGFSNVLTENRSRWLGTVTALGLIVLGLAVTQSSSSAEGSVQSVTATLGGTPEGTRIYLVTPTDQAYSAPGVFTPTGEMSQIGLLYKPHLRPRVEASPGQLIQFRFRAPVSSLRVALQSPTKPGGPGRLVKVLQLHRQGVGLQWSGRMPGRRLLSQVTTAFVRAKYGDGVGIYEAGISPVLPR